MTVLFSVSAVALHSFICLFIFFLRWAGIKQMLALDREEFGLIAASPIFFSCLLRAFYMCVTGNKSIPAMLVVAILYQPFLTINYGLMEWIFRFLFIPSDNIAFQAKIVPNFERNFLSFWLQFSFCTIILDIVFWVVIIIHTYPVKIYFTSGQLKGFPD